LVQNIRSERESGRNTRQNALKMRKPFPISSSCYHALPFNLLDIKMPRLISVHMKMVQKFFLRDR